MMEPISQEWIKKYVDSLLAYAKACGDTPLRNAALVRADSIMDMVKAWRERNTKETTDGEG